MDSKKTTTCVVQKGKKKLTTIKTDIERMMAFQTGGVNRCKRRYLSRCRQSLGLSPYLLEVLSGRMKERMLHLTGLDLTECPRCKQGQMRRVAELPMLLVCVWANLQVMPEILDTS